METKKSDMALNLDIAKSDKKKKSNGKISGTELGVGLGVATVVGATVGGVIGRNTADGSTDDEPLAQLEPDDQVQDEATAQEEMTDDGLTQPDDKAEGTDKQGTQHEEPKVEEPKTEEPKIEERNGEEPKPEENDPNDVAERLIEKDEVDPIDNSENLTAVEWRDITDASGNEVHAMIFADENGIEIAFAESVPGSGIYDKAIDGLTGMEVEMPHAASYTSADFEGMLHNDGGYIAPDPNGPHFAQNDDIDKDIFTTDNGELVAERDRRGGSQEHHADDEPVVDIDGDEVDPTGGDATDDNLAQTHAMEGDSVADDIDEGLLAQILGDDDADVNEDLVEIVDDINLDEPEVDEELLEDEELDESMDDELDDSF